jgi:hypothetical protein
MIPNCEGCKLEMQYAYEGQEMGYDIALEGMGVREHCFMFDVKFEEDYAKDKNSEQVRK